MKDTTVGKLLVNEVLPADLRDENRVLDKKGIADLLREIGQRYPGRYREISHRLLEIGQKAAYTTGGMSFGPEHMRQTRRARERRAKIQQEIDRIVDDDSLTAEERDNAIILAAGRVAEKEREEIYQESLKEGNPLALQILSGARGSPMNHASLRGSDWLYTDHRDRVIPVPVMKSYSQGLTPFEYGAGAYGARKGVTDLKFATRDAGYLSKQLVQVAHRAMVTENDREKPAETLRGLPVDTDDDESAGALLALAAGGYKRNTILTPKILRELKHKGIDRILVRSPAADGTADGGVYARDVGVREFGRLPLIGSQVGITAAQALSEPLTQAQISSKHSGGVAGAGKAISGFDYINQLVQVPKSMKGVAAHASKDGLVQAIREAPAGGQYVVIDNEPHYVSQGFDVKVKKGDHVEAGDVISDGTPNPQIISQLKHIGEGKRYFINTFRQAFRDAGLKGDRRNIELLARGLINHVRLTKEMGDYVPGDVVPYTSLEHAYKPRVDSRVLTPREAVGKYLERPYLHYSIGTQIKPSMLKNFEEFGVSRVDVHDDAPPFEPEMIRGAANLQHDPDWITQNFGSSLKSNLLKSTHRGATSDPGGTSFVPALAMGQNFGQQGKVRSPTALGQQALKLSEHAAQLREKMSQLVDVHPHLAQDPRTRIQGLKALYGGLGGESLEENMTLLRDLQQSYPGGWETMDQAARDQYTSAVIRASREANIRAGHPEGGDIDTWDVVDNMERQLFERGAQKLERRVAERPDLAWSEEFLTPQQRVGVTAQHHVENQGDDAGSTGYWMSRIPFAGGGWNLAETFHRRNVLKRMQEGAATPHDYSAMARWVARDQQAENIAQENKAKGWTLPSAIPAKRIYGQLLGGDRRLEEGGGHALDRAYDWATGMQTFTPKTLFDRVTGLPRWAEFSTPGANMIAGGLMLGEMGSGMLPTAEPGDSRLTVPHYLQKRRMSAPQFARLHRPPAAQPTAQAAPAAQPRRPALKPPATVGRGLHAPQQSQANFGLLGQLGNRFAPGAMQTLGASPQLKNFQPRVPQMPKPPQVAGGARRSYTPPKPGIMQPKTSVPV